MDHAQLFALAMLGQLKLRLARIAEIAEKPELLKLLRENSGKSREVRLKASAPLEKYLGSDFNGITLFDREARVVARRDPTHALTLRRRPNPEKQIDLARDRDTKICAVVGDLIDPLQPWEQWKRAAFAPLGETEYFVVAGVGRQHADHGRPALNSRGSSPFWRGVSARL